MCSMKMDHFVHDIISTCESVVKKSNNETESEMVRLKQSYSNLEKKYLAYKSLSECWETKCQKLETETQLLKTQNAELLFLCKNILAPKETPN